MSARYNVDKAADGVSYQFTTTSCITYVAYFTEFTLLTPHEQEIDAISFGFTCNKASEVKRHGGKVKQTIIHIIEDFFEAQPDDALLYMCMNSEGKGRNRHITFGRWFRDAGDNLEKHNSISKNSEEEFYISIILKTTNPKKEKLIEAFYYTINSWGL